MNAESIAYFLLGLRNVEHSEIIRRSYPTDFKHAVRLAKLEEVASRTKDEQIQPFYKHVKLAVQNELPQRREEYHPYDERRFSRPRDATQQRPYSPQDDRRDYPPQYYQHNERQSRDHNRYENDNFHPRERSQDGHLGDRAHNLTMASALRVMQPYVSSITRHVIATTVRQNFPKVLYSRE